MCLQKSNSNANLLYWMLLILIHIESLSPIPSTTLDFIDNAPKWTTFCFHTKIKTNFMRVQNWNQNFLSRHFKHEKNEHVEKLHTTWINFWTFCGCVSNSSPKWTWLSDKAKVFEDERVIAADSHTFEAMTFKLNLKLNFSSISTSSYFDKILNFFGLSLSWKISKYPPCQKLIGNRNKRSSNLAYCLISLPVLFIWYCLGICSSTHVITVDVFRNGRPDYVSVADISVQESMATR